jgi:hypothetical protein
MSAESWNEPWVVLLRQRCPLLDLGFQLDTPPADEPDDESAPVAEEEEFLADDFAEMSDPYQILNDELEQAGSVALELLRRLAVCGSGELRSEAEALMREGSGRSGLAFLQAVNAARGADLAAGLGEIGHKLPLVLPARLPPGRQAAELDILVADVLAALVEPGRSAEELRGGGHLADVIAQLQARLAREVS